MRIIQLIIPVPVVAAVVDIMHAAVSLIENYRREVTFDIATEGHAVAQTVEYMGSTNSHLCKVANTLMFQFLLYPGDCS